MIEQIKSILTSQFNDKLKVIEKRPGIYQLFLPFYHEDGDMIEIFLQKEGSCWKVSDYAMAYMRLSCGYKLDTNNKEKIFQKIISENGLKEDNGNIFIESNDEWLYTAILQFALCIVKLFLIIKSIKRFESLK